MWFRSLYRNLKELVKPPKRPPLEVTSHPVTVSEMWGQYAPQKRSWAFSVAFQSVLVLLLFTVFSAKTVQQKVGQIIPLFAPDISPYEPKLAPKANKMSGGGGGGDRSPLPAAKGRLPKASLKQFT